MKRSVQWMCPIVKWKQLNWECWRRTVSSRYNKQFHVQRNQFDGHKSHTNRTNRFVVHRLFSFFNSTLSSHHSFNIGTLQLQVDHNSCQFSQVPNRPRRDHFLLVPLHSLCLKWSFSFHTFSSTFDWSWTLVYCNKSSPGNWIHYVYYYSLPNESVNTKVRANSRRQNGVRFRDIPLPVQYSCLYMYL